jgi:pyruvate/2-oxoglutarate dehydrogenase complex dihydrolipoamide dehydrogenase (E3) component
MLFARAASPTARMSADTFDAIAIAIAFAFGAGQAGSAIAARGSKEGSRSAVIERGALGGTCVNVGCVPTKTVVASAGDIPQARRSADAPNRLCGRHRRRSARPHRLDEQSRSSADGSGGG